jgi:hypothetical protein
MDMLKSGDGLPAGAPSVHVNIPVPVTAAEFAASLAQDTLHDNQAVAD